MRKRKFRDWINCETKVNVLAAKRTSINLTMGSFQVEGKSLWRQDGGVAEEEQRLVTSLKETSDQKTSAVLLEMTPVCIEGRKMGGGLPNNGSAEMSGSTVGYRKEGSDVIGPGRKWDDSENKEVFVIEMLCAKNRLWLPLTELLPQWTPLILVWQRCCWNCILN